MSKVPPHKHTRYEERITELESLVRKLEAILRNRTGEIITVYSADSDVCIGHENNKWHKIVCEYEGTTCTGRPRSHWMSKWEIKCNGMHLISMFDHKFKGWQGQYEPGELRYDELPRDILKLHVDAMSAHIAKFSTWLPCHIFNDLTGDLYRP